MQLSEQSRLVRWTYFLRDRYYNPNTGKYSKAPAQTTLCRFFWRCFVFMPLFWVIVPGFPLTIIGLAIHDFGIWNVLKFVVTTLSVLLAIIGAVVVYNANWSKGIRASIRHATTDSVFVQGVKAVKGKLCPIITFR